MPRLSDQRKSERREIVAFFGALCLFLSAVEYLFPKPVPFLRLGLANLPLIIGLTFLRPGDLAVVLALKVLGQALVNGTLASYVFLFSLAGSTVSVLVMAATYRWGGAPCQSRRRISCGGVGQLSRSGDPVDNRGVRPLRTIDRPAFCGHRDGNRVDYRGFRPGVFPEINLVGRGKKKVYRRKSGV